MIRVRYTGNSLYSRRDGPTWTPEDPVHDVDEPLAEALTRRARFERVDPAEGIQPDPEGASADGTCAGTTANGDPCENPAGEDGYCHLASHGP